jgi:hypothetical protein
MLYPMAAVAKLLVGPYALRIAASRAVLTNVHYLFFFFLQREELAN